MLLLVSVSDTGMCVSVRMCYVPSVISMKQLTPFVYTNVCVGHKEQSPNRNTGLGVTVYVESVLVFLLEPLVYISNLSSSGAYP